jgi:hypothetical protein
MIHAVIGEQRSIRDRPLRVSSQRQRPIVSHVPR